MEIKLPNYIKHVLDKLNKHGYAAYVVGGCVRDSLLGIEPKDWDVTTDATPDETEKIFSHTIPTGKRFGTITVICHEKESKETYSVEVTTFRADGEYLDGRRPEKVTFGKDIIEDLSRRDLTINAMAYNELVGLVDPFNGQQDLENKIISFVGNTEDRIKEDALRILRAIRFTFRLDFNMCSIAENVLDSMASLLDKVSKERVHDELIQILSYLKDKQYEDFVHFRIPNIFKYIFEIENVGSIQEHLFDDIPYTLKLAYILRCKKLYEAEIWLRKYKFSNNNIEEIITFINLINDMNNIEINENFNLGIFIKNLLRTYDEIYVIRYFKYYCKGAMAYNINQYIVEPYKVKHLKLTGENLIEKGLQGKQIGECLEYLLDYVITDPELNNEEDLYNIVDRFILYKKKETT